MRAGAPAQESIFVCVARGNGICIDQRRTLKEACKQLYKSKGEGRRKGWAMVGAIGRGRGGGRYQAWKRRWAPLDAKLEMGVTWRGS